jgi:hypothetical protein
MALWTQERVDGHEFTIVPIEVVVRGAESTQVIVIKPVLRRQKTDTTSDTNLMSARVTHCNSLRRIE